MYWGVDGRVVGRYASEDSAWTDDEELEDIEESVRWRSCALPKKWDWLCDWLGSVATERTEETEIRRFGADSAHVVFTLDGEVDGFSI